MGDHEATEDQGAVSRAIAFLKSRAKAVAAAVVGAATVAVTAVIADPETAESVAAVVPEPIRPLIPILFLALTTIAVERVRNRKQPAADDEGTDLTEPVPVSDIDPAFADRTPFDAPEAPSGN